MILTASPGGRFLYMESNSATPRRADPVDHDDRRPRVSHGFMAGATPCAQSRWPQLPTPSPRKRCRTPLDTHRSRRRMHDPARASSEVATPRRVTGSPTARLVDDGWGLQVEVAIGTDYLILPSSSIGWGTSLLAKLTSPTRLWEMLADASRALRSHYGLPAREITEDAVPTLAGSLLPLLDEALANGEVAAPDEPLPPQMRWVLTACDVRTAATRLVGRSASRPTIRALAEVLLGDRAGDPSDLVPVCLAWVGSRLGLEDDQIAAILRAHPEGERLHRVVATRDIVRLMVLLDGMPRKQLTRVFMDTLRSAAEQEALFLAADLTDSVRAPDWSDGGPGTTAGVLERINEKWLHLHGDSPLPQPSPDITLDGGRTLRWHESPAALAARADALTTAWPRAHGSMSLAHESRLRAWTDPTVPPLRQSPLTGSMGRSSRSAARRTLRSAANWNAPFARPLRSGASSPAPRDPDTIEVDQDGGPMNLRTPTARR